MIQDNRTYLTRSPKLTCYNIQSFMSSFQVPSFVGNPVQDLFLGLRSVSEQFKPVRDQGVHNPCTAQQGYVCTQRGVVYTMDACTGSLETQLSSIQGQSLSLFRPGNKILFKIWRICWKNLLLWNISVLARKHFNLGGFFFLDFKSYKWGNT